MNGAGKTRTQRRLEKRQAIILLALVLAVSLASFTLGVIVGRRGAERDLAHKIQQTERVLVAEAPAEASLSEPESAPPVPLDTPPEEPQQPDSDGAGTDTRLSFYDDLAREDAPLGSGINLEPVQDRSDTARPEATDATSTAPTLSDSDSAGMRDISAEPTATAALAPSGTSVTPPPELPAPAVDGSHAVQIGSFGKAADAIALKNRMLDKDYPAFVREVDLGDKGLWYRVRIGPYAGSDTAGEVLEHLQKNEQLEGFVSRE